MKVPILFHVYFLIEEFYSKRYSFDNGKFELFFYDKNYEDFFRRLYIFARSNNLSDKLLKHFFFDKEFEENNLIVIKFSKGNITQSYKNLELKYNATFNGYNLYVYGTDQIERIYKNRKSLSIGNSIFIGKYISLNLKNFFINLSNTNSSSRIAGTQDIKKVINSNLKDLYKILFLTKFAYESNFLNKKLDRLVIFKNILLKDKSIGVPVSGLFYFVEEERENINNFITQEELEELIIPNLLENIPTAMELQYKEFKRSSIKSAISTIMSRNMSHNLGSHVLNRASENIYFEKFEDNRDLYRYLQQRMDFIAQITTEIPKWTTNHYFVKEIMSGFLKQKHLLKYIVKAEGVKGKTIGKVYEVILSDNHSHMCINVSKEEKKDEDKEYRVAIIYKDKEEGKYKIDLDKVQNDLQISVPGGFVGFHALYSMLENIIRNAAKHSYTEYPEDYKTNYCNSEKKMDLDINIKLEKIGENDIICEIYDNVSFVSGLKVDENKRFEEYGEIKIICLEEMETNDIVENLKNIIKDNKNIKISVEEISKDDLKVNRFEDKNTLFYILIDTCILRKNKELRSILIKEPRKEEVENESLENKDLLENPNVRLVDKFHICNVKNIKELERVLEGLYIPLHLKLQEKLDKPFINEDASLRQGDWGMAELKICAGFLTKAGLMEMNNNKRENGEKIIEAVATTGVCISYNKDGNIIIEQEPVYRLGFRFRLLPPKRIVIFDSERKFPIESKEILIKTGRET